MTRVKPKALLSWSSGKDSAWSLHVLRQQNEVEIVGACQQNVLPSVIVIITPGNRTIGNAWQSGVDVAEPSTRVPPNLGNGSSVRVATGQEDVQSSVVVKIAPGNRTFGDSRQAGVDVAEPSTRVPPNRTCCRS